MIYFPRMALRMARSFPSRQAGAKFDHDLVGKRQLNECPIANWIDMLETAISRRADAIPQSGNRGQGAGFPRLDFDFDQSVSAPPISLMPKR